MLAVLSMEEQRKDLIALLKGQPLPSVVMEQEKLAKLASSKANGGPKVVTLNLGNP